MNEYYCELCKRDLNSMVVMPIHQHAPNCPERLRWEKENPEYTYFAGREWEEFVTESAKRIYERGR